MMLIDIGRKELQLKTKAVDTLQVSMENSDKAMKMLSDSITSLRKDLHYLHNPLPNQM